VARIRGVLRKDLSRRFSGRSWILQRTMESLNRQVELSTVPPPSPGVHP
jgi:hypothetical protein